MAEPGPEIVSGFAPLPHRLCADASFSDTAYRVLGALMRLAHDQPTCFPNNQTLARLAGGKSVSTVVRALRELESLGLIRRVLNPETQHRDGIELDWSALGGQPVPPPKPARTPVSRDRAPLSAVTGGYVSRDRGGMSAVTGVEEYKELIQKTPPTPPSGGTGVGGIIPDPDPECEPFAAPAPESPPAVPAPPPSGWRPEDFARLDAEAERLFPLLEFGTKVRRNAHLFPPAYFEAALKEAARTGKRIRFPYVLAICQRFEEDGGPPPPERSGVGVRPQGPSTPIPDYVTPPPNGYRKSYPTPKKRGQP